MGWDDWNHFGCHVDESLVRQTADAMVRSGMKALGYDYVIVDDCWLARGRDKNGDLQPDPAKFPHGMRALADYVHHRGLKLGLYEDVGTSTCAGYPGSFGYEARDAARFAAWGVDYLKYDFCTHPLLNWAPDFDKISLSDQHVFKATYEADSPSNTVTSPARRTPCPACASHYKVGHVGDAAGVLQFNIAGVPASGRYELTIYYTNGSSMRIASMRVNGGATLEIPFRSSGGWYTVATTTVPVTLSAGNNTIAFSNPMTRVDNARFLYQRIHDALVRTGRSIVLSICDPNRKTEPWTWGARIGNLWRTTEDIRDTWASMAHILDQQAGLAPYAGPGHWNDPDMLEVGNGGLNDAEYRAQFSLWSILSAPLIAGNDLRTMSRATREILTNRDVIAVDQDPAGVEGTRIMTDGQWEAWSRPLANGDHAVLFLNRSNRQALIKVNTWQLGLDDNQPYQVRDLWSHRESSVRGVLGAAVSAHSVVMFRVETHAPHRKPTTR